MPAFLALTFGIAWLVWELPLRLGVPINSDAFKILVVPGTFAPAIAAIVVRKWVTREGFGDAGLELKPHTWTYYVAGFLMVIAVLAFVVVTAPIVHLDRPDYSLQSAHISPLSLVAQLSVASVILTPMLWGEEFGWRSYLQLRLFPASRLFAAVSTGLIWGIWHFPLLASGSEFPAHPYLSLVIFPIGTVLYSIIFGWLRERSESVWAPSLAHSTVNNLGSPLLVQLFAARQDLLSVTLLGFIPLTVFGVAILLTARKAERNDSDTTDH